MGPSALWRPLGAGGDQSPRMRGHVALDPAPVHWSAGQHRHRAALLTARGIEEAEMPATQPPGGAVLVLNSGSSSVKFALVVPASGERLARGLAERLGTPEAVLRFQQGPSATAREPLPGGTHADAVGGCSDGWPERVTPMPCWVPVTGWCMAASGSVPRFWWM